MVARARSTSPRLGRTQRLVRQPIAAAVGRFGKLFAFAAPLALALQLALAASASAGAPQYSDEDLSGRIDSILVVKSERRLYLLHDGQPVRSYPVALGLSPVGPKRQEFDFRTPEGRYVIDARQPNSHYFMALHVSYPNSDDLQQAAARHVAAGGDIMIHGLPNVRSKPLSYYQTRDWTNGCIALSNEDLVEVWSMVRHRVPVEIRP
jgi:murein L,D-transpeptidase YafK